MSWILLWIILYSPTLLIASQKLYQQHKTLSAIILLTLGTLYVILQFKIMNKKEHGN